MTTLIDTIDVINTRASIRAYDPDVKISKEDLTQILELATKAPSAWNLQHWHFTVFHSDESKQKLLPIAFNQDQIVKASAVVAILGDVKANLNGDAVYGPLAEAGYITEEIKDNLLGQINRAYTNESYPREAALTNASLAAMQLMIAAKAKGFDTCAIGGFNKGKFAEAFEIDSRYVPIMLITVGKSVKPAHQSGRFPVSEVSTWL